MKIDITHIAKLANLALSKEEKTLFEKQLEEILGYVTQVESVETKDVEPTFNISVNRNIMRQDQIASSLTQEEATANSKNKKNGYFVTKGVFESE